MGDPEGARDECDRAAEMLAPLDLPALSFQMHYARGQIARAAGEAAAAYEAYRAALRFLETLRSSLRGEELKIAFLKNKLEVYESLVDLCLARGGPRRAGGGLRLRRAGQVAQPAGAAAEVGRPRPPAPHRQERHRAPGRRAARGAELVLPPHRGRADCRRRRRRKGASTSCAARWPPARASSCACSATCRWSRSPSSCWRPSACPWRPFAAPSPRAPPSSSTSASARACSRSC